MLINYHSPHRRRQPEIPHGAKKKFRFFTFRSA